MKKFYRRFLLKATFICIGFSSLVLSSCSSLQEVPNSLNMPLPEKIHEVKTRIDIGTGGLGLQASYAIDSHVVLISSTKWNYAFKSATDQDGGPISIYHNEWVEDIGVGYFKKLNDKIRFEVMGGLGLSFTKFSSLYENLDLAGDSYYDDYFNGNIIHVFTQADLGIVHRAFALGIGVRLSDRYYTGNYENFQIINQGGFHQFTDDKYRLNVNTFYVEPGIVASFGRGFLKYNIIFGLSINTTGFELNPAIAHNEAAWLPLMPIFLSTGFTYRIHGK